MTSLWLSKKKKPEIIDLCHLRGISTEGYLKADLESMLAHNLEQHQSELINDPTFAPYFDSQASRSPTKTSAPTIELTEKRSRRRTSRYIVPASGSFDNNSTDAESTPEPTGLTERKTRSGSRALATRTPRTVRSLRDAASVPLPPSPAAVANAIESSANAILASAKKTVEKAEIQEKATGVRDTLSNVVAVNSVSLLIEAGLLLVTLIPVSYVVQVPAVATLGTKSYVFTVPDLFVLLTSAFWAPFLTWLTTSIVLPVANAHLFNIIATTVRSKDGEYKADPLTFAVTKALIAYMVHYKSFTFGGLFAPYTVETVAIGVGRELQLVDSGIGGLAAIWEGILRR